MTLPEGLRVFNFSDGSCFLVCLHEALFSFTVGRKFSSRSFVGLAFTIIVAEHRKNDVDYKNF